MRVSYIFQEFIKQVIEDGLGIRLSTQRYAQGTVFRHRADLMYGAGERPLLYVETKVIFRPERVRPDHDKRMYQIALASIDLKLNPSATWVNSKRLPPCVAFALAIPSNTPQGDLKHVEDDMYKLLRYYLNACCLYIFDLDVGKRRDDLLRYDELTIDTFLNNIAKCVKPYL